MTQVSVIKWAAGFLEPGQIRMLIIAAIVIGSVHVYQEAHEAKISNIRMEISDLRSDLLECVRESAATKAQLQMLLSGASPLTVASK